MMKILWITAFLCVVVAASLVTTAAPVLGEKPSPSESEPKEQITDADKDLIAVLASHKKNGVLPYMCVFPKAGGQGA